MCPIISSGNRSVYSAAGIKEKHASHPCFLCFKAVLLLCMQQLNLRTPRSSRAAWHLISKECPIATIAVFFTFSLGLGCFGPAWDCFISV